jgi:hypothetical protein
MLIFTSTVARADCVAIKYRGTCVPLEKLDCTNTASSFVNEVRYDAKNSYMVILLNSTRYHDCGIPQAIVTALIDAGSVGRFYNSQVKGKFGCQGQVVPAY